MSDNASLNPFNKVDPFAQQDIISQLTDDGQFHAQKTQITNRQFKDTLLRALFKDEKRLIELYNAISNKNYPESAKVVHCPTNPIMAMFNDLAFFIESKLIVVCEHQSTINPNMPIRLLFYIADLLRTYAINKDNIYRRELVKIPTPEFFVLYNGKDKLKDQIMCLSDAFLLKDREFTLDLKAKIIDINYESGEEAIKQSETLRGYSFLIAEVEKNVSCGNTRDEAIWKAINKCIEKGVLAEFLKRHLKEVVDMLTFEYDQEAAYRAMRLDGIQEGKREGIQEGKREGIQEGKREGIQEGKREFIFQMVNKGKSYDEIAEFVGIPKSELQQLIN